MRISGWRGSGKRARVELAEMSAETRDVVVIRNSLQIFSGRSDAWAVKRHTRLTYRYGGRDFRLTDVAGNVVHDVVA